MNDLSTAPPSDLEPQPPERPSHVLHEIANGINKVAGAPAQAIDALNTGFAVATQGIAQLFPALPAAAMGSLVIGFPHAHIAHPPSGPPPIPPTPLPPVGVVLAGCCVQLLINGRPAARCGDITLNPTCCGLPPLGEIKTGSSSVFIGEARAARMTDITMHCTPVPGGAGTRAAATTARTAATTAKAVAMKGIQIGGMAMHAAGMVAQGFEIAADAVESTETEDPAMAAALGLSAGMMAAQMAMDVAAMALAAAMGKDPCLPPTGTPGAVTAITSGNVLIGGFPMPAWMDIAKGLFKLAKGLKNKGRNRRSQNNKCDRPGHPINPVTGANEDEFVDYEESSPLSFCWGRNYTSADADRAGPMGFEFRHTYERRLSLDLDGVVYTDAEGKRVAVPALAPGQPETAREGYVLRVRIEGEDTIYALTPTGEPTMEFVHENGRDAAPRFMRLLAPAARADLLYDAHGRLIGMRETAPAGAVVTEFVY